MTCLVLIWNCLWMLLWYSAMASHTEIQLYRCRNSNDSFPLFLLNLSFVLVWLHVCFLLWLFLTAFYPGEDLERNDGSTAKPYYMSASLHRILGKKELSPKKLMGWCSKIATVLVLRKRGEKNILKAGCV